MSDSKQLFAKDGTELSHQIGPVLGVIITLGFTIGLGWERDVFSVAASAPLPENMWFGGIPPFVMSLLITGVVVLIVMLGYSVLCSAMPRSGGGYVAISRIIGPLPGFLAAWFEFLSIAWTMGAIATSIIYNLLYVTGPITFTIPLGPYSDVELFLGGIVVIGVFCAISMLGLRVEGSILQALFWVPAALTIYVLYLLASSIANPTLLQAGISTWAHLQGVSGVTADTYVRAALNQGLDSARVADYWTAVSVSLLFTYFNYVGYAATTFVVGEVRDPKRNLPKILLVAPIIILAIYLTMAYVTTYATASVGQVTLPNGDRWSFFDAYSYLSYSGNLAQAGVPQLTARVQTIAEMIGVGMGLGQFNSILLFLFAIMWILKEMPALILTGSRLLFAMSFDRVLPTGLSKVSRFGSPFYAVIVVGLVAVLGALGNGGSCVVCTGGSWNPSGALGGALNGFFVDGVTATDLMDVVFFSLFSVAVLLFPLRHKHFFDAAHFKPGGKLGVASIGLAGLVANLIIGWEILISPADSYNILSPNSDNWFAIGFTLLVGIIGCLIYSYYRLGSSKKNYSRIFSEIPPE